MRRMVVVLATAIGLVFAGVIPVQAATQTDIWIKCAFTGLSATIDPILDPGSTSTAHFHDFFGNTIAGNFHLQPRFPAGLWAGSDELRHQHRHGRVLGTHTGPRARPRPRPTGPSGIHAPPTRLG